MSALTRWEPSTRWNPWKELEEVEKRLSTIFGRPAMGTNDETKEAISVTEMSPLDDITDDDKESLDKAEIPTGPGLWFMDSSSAAAEMVTLCAASG